MQKRWEKKQIKITIIEGFSQRDIKEIKEIIPSNSPKKVVIKNQKNNNSRSCDSEKLRLVSRVVVKFVKLNRVKSNIHLINII